MKKPWTDPQSRQYINHFHLIRLVFPNFEKRGRTDLKKIVITTYLDCESAEWINFIYFILFYFPILATASCMRPVPIWVRLLAPIVYRDKNPAQICSATKMGFVLGLIWNLSGVKPPWTPVLTNARGLQVI